MRERLVLAFTNLGNSIVSAVPNVVVGILLIAAALIVAKLIERSLRFVLSKVGFDALVGKAGIDLALQRLGIQQQLTYLLPRLVYYLAVMLFAKTAVDAMGLVAISDAIGAFFAYLPNIVAALLVLILGSSLSQFAGEAVSRAAENSGIDFAPSLGKAVSGLIVFVSAMMAIAQLKIDTEIIRIIATCVLAGGALAFGLSFGLGTRDVVRNIAAGFYARKVFVVGKEMEIAGHKGVLSAITSTHVILKSEDRETSVANAMLLEQIARQ